MSLHAAILPAGDCLSERGVPLLMGIATGLLTPGYDVPGFAS